MKRYNIPKILQFPGIIIEQIVKEGIQKGEIVDTDPNVVASGIFGFTCSSLIYEKRSNKDISVQKLYQEIEKAFIRRLKK